MTIRTALIKLRDVVAATSPTTVHGPYPSAFTFAADASAERYPRTRGFWLEVGDRSRKGPYTTGHRRHLRDVDVIVRYEATRDTLEREIVIEEDAVALTDALLDETQWDSATTGIVAVSAGVDVDQPTILEATKQRDPDGVALLAIRLVLEVREA